MKMQLSLFDFEADTRCDLSASENLYLIKFKLHHPC